MSRNKIQMQYGLGLVAFQKTFPDEESCRKYIEEQKWPNGFRCSECQHDSAWKSYRGARQTPHYCCCRCRHNESLLSGTLFERTHLPLKVWFQAIELLTQSKTCVSAMELHRQLEVNDKTSLLLKHKIMQAMTDSERERVLGTRIEIDDAYLGGVAHGGKSGRGADKKVPFIAAVETDKKGHPLYVIIEPVSGFTNEVMKQWSGLHIAPASKVCSDGLACFCAMQNCEHCRYIMKNEGKLTADSVFKWVNIIISNIKTALGGTLHSFNFKAYAQRYLGMIQFRFNHRFDLRQCFFEMVNITVKSGVKTRKMLQYSETG